MSKLESAASGKESFIVSLGKTLQRLVFRFIQLVVAIACLAILVYVQLVSRQPPTHTPHEHADRRLCRASLPTNACSRQKMTMS